VAGAAPARLAAASSALALFAAVCALLAQGLLHSLHSGLVLSRADTRNLTRAWMVAHVPPGSPIVVEPVAPDEWARELAPGPGGARPYRWIKYHSLVPRITAAGALGPEAPGPVRIENYERTLAPALVSYYQQHRYCWVVSGSTQSGRAFANRAAAPLAVTYYGALRAASDVVYHVSPFGRGRRPVPFGFDWSFDYYPLAYHRPGPAMTVFRLHGGRCGP
jgi:hypothetical protein